MENSPVQGPDGKMHVNKCAMCQSILYVRGLTNLLALLGPWASKWGTAFKLCIVTVSFETVKGSYQYELMDSYFIQQVIIHYYYYIFYIPIVLISWWFLFKLIFVSFSHVPNFFDIFLAFWLRYFSLHL